VNQVSHNQAHRAVLFALVALTAGCRENMHHDLDERGANELVVVLSHAGVAARKDPRAENRWDVSVPATQTARALEVATAAGLPRREIAAADPASGGLVPSADQESARRARELGAELERTLLAMPGVLDARIHLVIPAATGRFDAQSAAQPRASVVVVHRANVAPPDEAAIRAVIQGAVESIAWDDIAIVWSPTALPVAAAASTAVVGPFVVASESAALLRVVLVALAVLLTVFAGATAALSLRRPGAA
jgi:type III secretion protein J